jgi:glycosyltransferase involved in cell wall biosynthesis
VSACSHPSHGRRVALCPWSAPPLPAERPKVSLTMIVRNEEANLPACLESARGLFDEIVVVDTGSIDRTREIPRSFGARVCDFVWVDDFAAARNAALARATGDHAFWLDADDVLDAPEREKLVTLPLRAGGFALRIRGSRLSHHGGWTWSRFTLGNTSLLLVHRSPPRLRVSA